MKLLLYILVGILIALITPAFMYLGFSFEQMSFDYYLWNDGQRKFYAFLSVILLILCTAGSIIVWADNRND